MSSESNTDTEERQWLSQHLAGDKNAFAQLMTAYRKPIYSYLVRNGLDKNVRDDLFQDIFFKIHKSAKNYDPSARLSPWIFTIAVNTVRNHIRDRKPTENHLSLCLDEGTALHLVDNSPTPEKITQSKHMMNWLQSAIGDLPPAQADALNLTIIKDMKLQDAAHILKLPLSTIKTHVRRARQNLLTAYQKHDNEPSRRSIS